MASSMFARTFPRVTDAVDYVNRNGIDMEDILHMVEQLHGSGWILLFFWDASEHEAVLAHGVHVGTGDASISGTPLVAGTLLATVSTEGAVGAAKFQWSLDGGTLSAEVATGASVALAGTGMTLAFTDGLAPTSFAVGDTYTVTLTVGGCPPCGKGVSS